ncbi:MAG TPA: hypothetical protein VKB58_04120 [Terriglobales bacterium]|nr:hypothetical protein [Terriglobales bacterium]
MKHRALHLLCIFVAAAGWMACGAGHPTITRITVSPSQASAGVRGGDVQFTANATFSNNTSRELTVADGLTWSVAPNATASISDNGSATCLVVGQAVVTATAPTELNLTINNGINNTSPKVSGTATLSCIPTP